MSTVRPRPKRLTHKAIRPFGYIIDARCVRDTGRKNAFGILLKEKAPGWRIGYLIVRQGFIDRLESHPDSLETFEPVKGRAIIALAPAKDPSAIKVFTLDKPVVLKKGVWHDVAAVSKRCEIKIFENSDVRVAYHYPKKIIVTR